MSKGLEALETIKGVHLDFAKKVGYDEDRFTKVVKSFTTIEKELKDREKILARLQVVQMKINAQLKEYGDSIEHFEEDDYMFIVYRVRGQVLNEISSLLKEVLS